MVDDAEIAEHREFYTTYLAAWNRRDIDALLELMAFPMAIGGNGREILTIPDAEAYRARTLEIFASLEAKGWAASEAEVVHVGLMAGDTGVLTVTWRRDRSDGSILERGTANYITRRIGGLMKMVGTLAP